MKTKIKNRKRIPKQPRAALDDVKKQLDAILAKKSFDQACRDGDILDVQIVRRRLGYTAWGLRRLCRAGDMPHFQLFGKYFFLKAQVDSVFKFLTPAA